LVRDYALNGGDDYELCFTAPAAQREAVIAAGQSCGTAVTRIGHLTAATSLAVVDHAGQVLPIVSQSFDHFSPP
jgi:thiamine-monophosphate kinase